MTQPGPSDGEAVQRPQAPASDDDQWRPHEEQLRDEVAALVGASGVSAPPAAGGDPTPIEPAAPSPATTEAAAPFAPAPASTPTPSTEVARPAQAAPPLSPAFESAPVAPPATTDPAFAAPAVAPPAFGPAPPAAPASPAARSPFADIPLTPRKLVPAAFDLLMTSQRDLRNASFYIGFLVLTTVGPAAALFWALNVRFGEGLEGALSGSAGGLAGFLVIIAVLGFFVAEIESRTLATAVLGGRAEGRPLGVGGAVTIARRRFWRAAAAGLLVGLLSSIANAIVTEALNEQIALPASLLVGVLVEAPFVYAIAGIVLGEVNVREALGRSTRLFGVRKRLAVTVSLFGIASQIVLILALFAGLDVVIRVVDALGFTAESSVSTFAGTLVAGALLFALGTLLFTAAALAAAPQVLAFTGLTHYTRGLEPARHVSTGRWPWDPFVTRGLAVTIIGALLLLFLGIGDLDR